MSVFDTISVYADVEIELDDVKNEVLRRCSIEELVDALATKNVDWDVTDNPEFHVLNKAYFLLMTFIDTSATSQEWVITSRKSLC